MATDEIARTLRRLREAHGLTQPEVARRTGLTQPKVSAHHSGKTGVPLSALTRYAAVYHTTVDAIDPRGEYMHLKTRRRTSDTSRGSSGLGDTREGVQMSELPKNTMFFGGVITAWNHLESDAERSLFSDRCRELAAEIRRRHRKNA